jgi:superfamily II DNA or RNA helicase/HKD family nuclease
MAELRPGTYERLITAGLDEQLGLLSSERVDRSRLDPADADVVLARHLGLLARRALRSLPQEASDDDRDLVDRQVALANQIAAAIRSAVPVVSSDDDLVAKGELLFEILDRAGVPGSPVGTDRPEVPLSASALLVNGRDQPRVGSEVNRELASADRVDLLCAFVKWHGLRVLEEQLAELVRRRRLANEVSPLRVITTTYIGATERRALDRLVELGAQVKISYETRMTRLHAKAWLFHRDSGYSTAYVGSSNLSKSALLDGLEWNVRLSQVEQGHLLDTFRATFDEYWEDPAFEPYDPNDSSQRVRLDEALAAEGGGPADLPIQLASLDVRPFGYQCEILDELAAEREIHDRHRNLVVMATGTGKTVVGGFDYRRLRNSGEVDSLLFVAHRDEILTQSQSMFRYILRNGTFGERLVGGDRPTAWRHVFASVQSLARLDLDDLDPSQFDMVIVDEFHHASRETKTYARLLDHLEPKVLLGLTATPERADGQDILHWFDGRIAVELRLWEALERNLLSPFQYFGVHDDTNLQALQWKRGTGYVATELTNVYTGDDKRVAIVLQAVRDKVADVRQMRALGFCVSIDHAEYMAHKFTNAGIRSVAVTSRTPAADRTASLEALRKREITTVFTVDLFNEGVDVPEIDTVLFLRPTESATVFLQQLGRGLRLADDKPCLTVLDFIGNQNREFRFDLRYRALTGTSRRGLRREIEHDFPTLPAGCHIALDRVATEIVLANVRASLRVDWKSVINELRELGDVSLAKFIDETGLELDDIYRRRRGGWAGLRRSAGLDDRPTAAEDRQLDGAIGRMLHVDDLERIEFLDQLLRRPTPPRTSALEGRARRLAAMAHFSLWGWAEPLENADEKLVRLWANPSRRDELLDVLVVLRERIRRVSRPVAPGDDLPLHLHARYSLAELLAAFGVARPSTSRGAGVRWIPEANADVFWFNLRKTEEHFSPTTMYADRAISPTLFQWESQNASSADRGAGERYVHHRDRGSSVHLFFRETKDADGDLGAPPYLYAGPASYVSHTGDRPMRIIWTLDHALPADVFHSARVAAG